MAQPWLLYWMRLVLCRCQSMGQPLGHGECCNLLGR